MLSKIKQYKWWFIIVTVVVIGGLYYRQTIISKNKAQVIALPEYRTIRQTLSVSGSIDADEKATLTFPASSRLSWVGIAEGDRVHQWQSIASVDTRTLEKQLLIDLNNFNKEFRDHDQTLDDYNYYDSYDFDQELRRILEKAQFDLDNSVLAVEIRDLAIKLSTLVSPVNGIVTRIDKPYAGATIGPLDVFEIVNPETIYFQVIIDEEDIGLVSLNQSAVLSLDAFPDEEYNSAVQFIEFSSSVTEGGGTGYAVKLTLPVDNIDLKYKLGMNGEAEIILDERSNVLSVPVDSLISRDGQDYVDVVRGEDIQRIEVGTGISDTDFIEIRSGLTSEDQVIIPSDGEE